jgi:ATP-dependent helicase/nuclease subunit B
LKRLNAEGKDFATTEDSVLIELLREEIEKLTKKDSFISNFVSRRGYNEFIINSAGRILEDCVMAIAQMVRAGSFRPRLSEVSFGKARDMQETLGNYELELPVGRILSLDGKIDRLDFADVEGQKVALIFDYKRRDTTPSWRKLYYGLDLQLPVYMLAARCSSGAKAKSVAGAFYMPIESEVKATTLSELQNIAGRFVHKAKGIFNGRFAQELDGKASGDSKFYNFYVTKDGEPYGSYGNRGAVKPGDFTKLLEFAERKVVALGAEITSGRIDVSPYRIGTENACNYCKYKPVCRFDWQINDYNFLESLSKSQVLERAEVVDG